MPRKFKSQNVAEIVSSKKLSQTIAGRKTRKSCEISLAVSNSYDILFPSAYKSNDLSACTK